MIRDSSYGQVIHLPRPPASGPHSSGSAPADQVENPAKEPGADPVLTDVLLDAPFDPAATGFVLSLLPRETQPLLWVRDRASQRENGQIYTPGLRLFGISCPVLQVTVSHPRDVLWTMEEGAACSALCAVVGEIHGAPSVLDFTATKRLAIRSEASGVPLYLIRSGDPGTLSAARQRWRLASLPSEPHPDDTQAPGQPRWSAELFRARNRAPGHWVAQYDTDTSVSHCLRLVPRSRDGQMAADHSPAPHPAQRRHPRRAEP
ncbi:ImuA family protein [Phaeobacter italicus]|uniref:ImuA family protein n=1 Tax=Phaeobacter italicus TaxID=481446 RepID=UPI0024328D83|nr:hypothetical protein [Phaeobacter italicus]MCI5099959.1 hypothetical protein [Phaeobacter italicus]